MGRRNPLMKKMNRRLFQLASIARREACFSAETQLLAVAITATEMQFRPLLCRFSEYIYALSLIAFGRDAGSVSVGVSQISIRHFVALEGINQLQSLLWAMSAQKSLTTCCKMIEGLNVRGVDDLRAKYNGNSTVFYRIVLRKNIDLLKNTGGRHLSPNKLQFGS